MALGEKVEGKSTGAAGSQRDRSEEGTLKGRGLTVMDAEKGWGPY